VGRYVLICEREWKFFKADSNALATALSAISTSVLDSNEFSLEGFSCSLKNLNNAMPFIA